MVICNDNVWLTVSVTFAVAVNSLCGCISVFSKPGNNDSFRTESPYIVDYLIMQIGLIFYFKHLVIWVVK